MTAPALDRTCPACGAAATEIRRAGHRRQDRATGEWWPRAMCIPPSDACPQACCCIPEHFSLEEHRADLAIVDEDAG